MNDREYQIAALAVKIAEFELHMGNYTERDVYDWLIEADLSLTELMALDDIVAKIVEQSLGG